MFQTPYKKTAFGTIQNKFGTKAGTRLAPPQFKLKSSNSESGLGGVMGILGLGNTGNTTSTKPGHEKSSKKNPELGTGPGSTGTYRARRGETFADIAKKFRISLKKLADLNYLIAESGNLYSLASMGIPVPIIQTGKDRGKMRIGVSKPEFIKVPTAGHLNYGVGDEGKMEYKKIEGKAFVKGEDDEKAVDPNDVEQGALADCYFIAAMKAVAKANPGAIRKLIRKTGENKYKVTLWVNPDKNGKRKKVEIEVDNTFPFKKGRSKPAYGAVGDDFDSDTGKDTKELWPLLLEKAYAKHKHGYDSIEYGRGWKALQMLTNGKLNKISPKSYKGKKGELLKLLDERLKAKWAITMGTFNKKKFKALKSNDAFDEALSSRHAYALKSVDLSAKTVSLYNPWGAEDDVDDVSVDSLILQFYYIGMVK